MSDRAEAFLGRGVVVAAGDAVPAPWADCAEVSVDDTCLDDIDIARRVAVDLYRRWVTRTPVVVRLLVDPARLTVDATTDVAPFELGAQFFFPVDTFKHLVWANNYDGRAAAVEGNAPNPRWWWADKAARIGGTVGGPADLVTADGRPAWVDGGPRAPLTVTTVDDNGVAVRPEVIHIESVQAGKLTFARWATPAPGLAPDQQAAVSHGPGPARVIAPAGSGKTRVMAARLTHLVGDRGIEADMVTALAYNNRAAAELRSRVPKGTGQIRTLHSLGLAVLRSAASDAGAQPPTILDERAQRNILSKLVSPPPAANTDPLGPYLEGFAAIRLGFVDPVTAEAERPDAPGLADAFAAYRHRLAASNSIDFDEQIYGAIEFVGAHCAIIMTAGSPTRRSVRGRRRSDKRAFVTSGVGR